MRFEFGSNWLDYSSKIDETHVGESINCLKKLLPEDVKGKSFLDIGCGSGIHSVAAVKLGAEVTSFDYDDNSVRSTQLLKSRFAPDLDKWQIEQGDVLKLDYINKYKGFDVVYSWGVLHHTGKMWQAITSASECTRDNGHFIIAIYNNQGWKSKFWWGIKYFYNLLPNGLNKLFGYTMGYLAIFVNIIKYFILLKPKVGLEPLMNYNKQRGMNIQNDLIDWIGGFPFEYATVEEIDLFLSPKGFKLINAFKTTSLGCNEMIFKKVGN